MSQPVSFKFKDLWKSKVDPTEYRTSMYNIQIAHISFHLQLSNDFLCVEWNTSDQTVLGQSLGHRSSVCVVEPQRRYQRLGPCLHHTAAADAPTAWYETGLFGLLYYYYLMNGLVDCFVLVLSWLSQFWCDHIAIL
jgi:hypothetical protein